MAQFVSRGGPDAFPTEVLTVAELLSRNAGHERVRPEPDTGGISVGALLRREGRAPHAADRPLKPRPHQEAAEEASGGTDRRVLVRRGAIAAGTLLAAGSVFGAAILTDVTPTVNEAAGGTDDQGSYPGQGLLDQEDPAVLPPDGVVIDQAAGAAPLDPGAAAPSNWVPVAFPGALAGSESGADTGSGGGDDAATAGGNPGGSGTSGSSGDDGSRVAAASDDDDDNTRSSSGGERASTSGGSQETTSGGSDGGSGGGSDDRSDDREEDRDDDRSLVGGLVGGLTDTLGLSSDDGDDQKRSSKENNGDEDGDSKAFSLFSAGDEDSSAPQDDEDGSTSRSSDESGDDESDDSGNDDGDDDGGDRGLVGRLLGTVGGLLR